MSNESINDSYDYNGKCVYCVYDLKRRNGKDVKVPRCDTDVSTRSRFFKHLQNLEQSLNRRLICFDEELPIFRLQDLLDKEKPPVSRSESADSSEASVANCSIASSSDPLDIFLQLLTNKNQNDLLAIHKVDRPEAELHDAEWQADELPEDERHDDEPTDGSVDSRPDDLSDSARSTEPGEICDEYESSNSDVNSEPNVHSSDETNSISGQSDSVDSLFDCSPVRSGPIIKSIKQIEHELNNRKLKKLKTDERSDIMDYVVRVNQITERNEINFLCYLDEL